MPLYAGFDPETSNKIKEALSLTKSKLRQYWIDKRLAVSEVHRDVVDKEFRKEIDAIERFESFLNEKAQGAHQMNGRSHATLMDTVRSALEIYLQDTIRTKARVDLPGFEARIEEIKKTINLESLKDRRADMYDRYLEPLLGDLVLEEKVPIILGFTSWIGGDMAKLNARIITEHLDFEEKETEKILDLLCTQRLLLREGRYYYLSNIGSRFTNKALLSLISKWSMISNTVMKYDFYTIQDAFLSYYSFGHPLRNLQMDIKSYVVDFCHTVMEKLLNSLGSEYSLRDYPNTRKMMERLSLVPLQSFVKSNDQVIENFLESLKNKKLISIERCLTYNDVIFLKYDLLRVKKAGGKKDYNKKT